MKKIIAIIVTLLLAVAIVACAHSDQKNEKNEIDHAAQERNVRLTDEEIKKVVEEHLNGIGLAMEEVWTIVYSQGVGPYISESIVDPEQDDGDARTLIKLTSEHLENYFTETILDEMTRNYIVLYFLHYKEGTNLGNLDTRFQVLEQGDDHFTVSYITIAEDAGYVAPGTNILHYAKENGHWLLQSYEFIDADERELGLTFAELEEAYGKFYHGEGLEFDFEPLEQLEEDGNTYLIARVNDYYVAIDTKSSEPNYSIAEKYNKE